MLTTTYPPAGQSNVKNLVSRNSMRFPSTSGLTPENWNGSDIRRFDKSGQDFTAWARKVQ